MAENKKGSSETIRAAYTEKILNRNLLSKSCYLHKKDPALFNHWLAGLLDADGCLLVSKAGYTSCEITVSEKEFALLALVKKKIGGSIKKRSKAKAYRWRLHNREGMISLAFAIDNKLLLEKRRLQLEKVIEYLLISRSKNNCLKKNKPSKRELLVESFSKSLSTFSPKILRAIPLKIEKLSTNEETIHSLHTLQNLRKKKESSFSIDNAWLAGFFEGEGYFRVNKTNLQLSVTLGQKDRFLLEKIKEKMGGSIFFDKSWDGWLYSASSREDIERWIIYFSSFPLISWKQVKLFRFKRLFLYKSRKVHLEKKGKPWLRFNRLLSNF